MSARNGTRATHRTTTISTHPEPLTMFFTRKRIYAALGATLIIAGAGGYTAWRGHGDAAMNEAKAAAHSPTATEVDVATVVAKTITDWQSYSGRLEAVDHVDIRPLVPGT